MCIDFAPRGCTMSLDVATDLRSVMLELQPPADARRSHVGASRFFKKGSAPMAKREVTREALKAMASLSGLELSDERVDELLPQVQRAVDGLAGLDVLDLESVEPAVVFRVHGE